MMRVLQFELFFKTGGIESFLLNLNEYIKKDVDCFVICPFEKTSDEESFSRIGTEILKISAPKRIIKYIFQIDKIMKTGDFDLVHMNKCSAINIIPVLLAYKNNIPIVVHSHNSMTRIGVLGLPLHFLNRFLMSKISSCNLACSDIAGQWMFGKKGNYTVIKNGINVSKYKFNKEKRNSIREELNISQKQIVFTNLGDLRKQKNPIFLIDIFKELVELLDTKLLIIGDGFLRSDVESEIEKTKINDHVVFLGHRPDVYDVLNAVDCLLMPSLFEGLPMSCIEAQANGLQLFLSDTISKETEVTKHVNWFSIEQSPKCIAQMIATNCKMVSDEDRLEDNRVVAESGFDYETMSQKIYDAYNRTINLA